MAWSSLPLIEMDEVKIRKERIESKDSARKPNRDSSVNLEKDIGKQLSVLREQSKTNKGSDEDQILDKFGRDMQRKPANTGDDEDLAERESSRRRERSRSPCRWREDDWAGDPNRGKDWGRDEPRRRGRDSYYGDGGDDTGRNGEGYRDWPSRGREPDRYRDRRDYDYRDRDDRVYRDRDDREYRDREDKDYRDRDERDWRRDRYDDRHDDDRRHDYRDRYRHEDDRHWSDHKSHDRYRDDRDYHRRDYREEPSEIVMLKGLPTTVEDTQIHEILSDAKLPYKDVRVVKTREGYSRGFAFVEFLDVETAKKWVEDCKGKLIIEEATVMMDFSRSKMAVESHRDWVCSKCGTQNFSSKRRSTCFTCNTPKDENDETKELGSTPCKVIILRGLDILTTEETIRQSLASFTSTPIFDVRLIKDKLTGTSRGFCFVELGSVEEATQLKEELQSASFKIDEKVLVISYAKFSTNPSKAGTVASGSTTSSTTTSVSETPTTSSTTNQSRSNFAANAIAQARAAAQMGHITDQQTVSSMDHYSTANDLPASSAADSTVSSEPSTETSNTLADKTAQTPADKTAQTPAAPQSISSYIYDASSGYYYDTTTGLYYDPTTQYYYNSTTQEYMYWDATTKQYVTVVSSANPSTTASGVSGEQSTDDNTAVSKEKQKKAKSLNAKKIAKDMERWAKKQAKSKEAGRPQATAQATQDAVKESTYQYDPTDLKGGIKMTMTGSTNMTSLATASPLAALSELDDPAVTSVPAAASSLVPEYAGEDSGGEEDTKEENYADWTKMACLLCKRQFPSKEALTRHIQLSDLHKQNLLVQKKLKMSFAEIDEYEKQQREQKYRDRAKERRELFGQPDSNPSAKKKRKGKISYEQPTKHGIQSDNIGNKMLQAMGWTAGTGLGKDRQGIVDPILAKMRNRTAGLGLKGSDYGATAGDSERDLLKKMAQSRYDDD